MLDVLLERLVGGRNEVRASANALERDVRVHGVDSYQVAIRRIRCGKEDDLVSSPIPRIRLSTAAIIEREARSSAHRVDGAGTDTGTRNPPYGRQCSGERNSSYPLMKNAVGDGTHGYAADLQNTVSVETEIDACTVSEEFQIGAISCANATYRETSEVIRGLSDGAGRALPDRKAYCRVGGRKRPCKGSSG